MGDLYINDYLLKQGFLSTEEYLSFCKNNNLPARFLGEKYFTSLFQNGIIVPEMSYIRTMYTAGMDESYSVTQEGKLEGLELLVHSGKLGVFEPAKILSVKEAPDGWDLEGFFRPKN